MTWEETILYARTTEEFKQLVKDAYLDADLKKNVENFIKSGEFTETLDLVNKFADKNNRDNQSLLDIGTGTGLLSLMVAQKNNVEIDAVEIDVDSAGRILLPDYLKEFGNLSKDVILVKSPTFFVTCAESKLVTTKNGIINSFFIVNYSFLLKKLKSNCFFTKSAFFTLTQTSSPNCNKDLEISPTKAYCFSSNV